MSNLYPNEPRIRWEHADLNDLLLWGSHSGMSDLALRSNSRAWVRVFGKWRSVTLRPISTDELLAGLERMTRNNSVAAQIKSGQKDYDFAHQIDEARGLRRRYRGNAMAVAEGYSTGVKIVFRVIASEPPLAASLNLEQAILDNAFPDNGLVLVTGVMGSGKTTLLAAIMREIIEKGGRHVATYEAPIEFDFDTIQSPGGPVSQSSIPEHLADFITATRNSTRTAPDVVLIGESRDRETLRGMTESAEIGVAAYSTVHSRSVPATISRILNVFPKEEHTQIAATLISSLRLIVSQRLIPHPSGEGRTALREYLPFTAEIKETLLDTPTERLIQRTEELLFEQGQTIQQAAEKAFSEGNIDKTWLMAIQAERRKKKNVFGVQENDSQHLMLELLSMGKELLQTLNASHQRRPDDGRGSFMAGYRACAQDFHFGRSRRFPNGPVAFPLGLVDGDSRPDLHSAPVSGAAHRHVAFGLRPRRARGAYGETPGNAMQRTPVAQTLPLVNHKGESMNTPSRNSHGLFDAPALSAVREPLALTQADLQRQLEDGAFALDREEAVKCGLINPYDDETAKVMVQ